MVLSAVNLSLAYKDGESSRTVLDNISINLDDSKANIIIGPSGSGKSSLIYLLSTLRKPTSGKILLNGRDLTTTRDTAKVRYDHFGFVFQQHFLVPYLTVRENVCLARKDKNLREEASRILTALDIEKISDKCSYEISGGERQRVAIARALVKNPDVIFADEPTASLDKENAHNVFSLLKEKTKDRILVLSTHDTSLLEGDERVIRIENCKLIG
jgi:ABC transporter related protein